MNQKFNIQLSKLLVDIFANNLSLGIVNLMIFYTFWVDGWSYPSLFIAINLSVIISFIVTRQYHINPSFNLKNILLFSTPYFGILFLLVISYWLIILDRKYYFIHIIGYISLTVTLNTILRFFWIKVLKNIQGKIYFPKNVMIVGNAASDIEKTINSNNWLNYNISYSMHSLNPIDLDLYINQYNLDILIYDINSHFNQNIIETLKELKNIKVLYIKPPNKSKLNLYQIIFPFKLYSY